MNIPRKSIFKSIVGLTLLKFWKKETESSKNFFWTSNPFKELKNPSHDLYLWGNGWYQAKPGSVPNFPNFSPKKQKFSLDKANTQFPVPNLKNLASSEKIQIGVDAKGNIWAFDNKKIPAQKKDCTLPVHKQKIQKKSGETIIKNIPSQNFLSNLQNINTSGKAISVKIVLSNVFALNEKGELYRSKLDAIQVGQPNWKKVSSVKNLKQIESGKRHLLMLNKNGDVFAMGDDTHGQCGSGDLDRIFSGPFVSRVVRNPQEIQGLKGQQVDRIFAAGSHNFALTKTGQVFGWGFNNLMQLGHEDQYSSPEQPRMAFFAPVNFSYFFKDHTVKDIALGLDFSLFICENNSNGITNVFGMGHNSSGQLGSGFPRHIQKLTKCEPLSGFEVSTESGGRVPLKLSISCGDKHCVSLGSNGALLIWGDNKDGQMGNKKRSFTGSPLILSTFAGKKVTSFQAFGNQTYVNVDRE